MLELQNDYKVKSYSYGFQLLKDLHKTDAKGNDIYDIISYHSDLNGVLINYCNERTKDLIEDSDITLKEVLELLRELKSEIRQYIVEVEV